MNRSWGILAAVFGVSISVAGCGNYPRTPYNGDPSVPKFQIKPTDYCQANSSGGYTTPDNITQGTTDNYVWAQGGGCVNRPIVEAWGVTHNIPLMQWGGVSSSSFKKWQPPKRTSYFYEVNYVVHSTLTVTWTMQWYHTIGFGDKTNPQVVWINYQRVAGTKYIPYWEGTIYLEQLDSGHTVFAMRNQIQAAQTGESDAAGAVNDVLTKIRTGTSVPLP